MSQTEALLSSRLILRPLKREPMRTALTMFAVALGVAVVVAIDLAGQAAAGSFHSSVESLTGKTDLHSLLHGWHRRKAPRQSHPAPVSARFCSPH